MSKQFENLPRYLTPGQTSEVLQISLSSFYKRAHYGQLPVIKMGGSLRVDKHALEKYLATNTRRLNVNTPHAYKEK